MENSPPTNRSKLKKIIQALHSKHDVDEKGQEILNLLEEHGKGIMEKAPEALVEMVGKAHNLIGSSLYTDIVQVMTDICRTHSQSQNELLECLVQQMGDETKMNEFIRHQQNLLSLFRILLVQDDSSDTRTVCLTLLWNSEFVHSKGFVLTHDFMKTVKFMLQRGADQAYVLEDFIYFTFFMPSIRADINVVSKLLEMLPAEIAKYQDPHNGTVLHALVSCKWEWFSNGVPAHLVQQYEGIIYKVVEANPDLLDVTDYYGQTAVHKLAKAVYDQPDKGCSLLNIFPVLVTQKNVNACDTNSVSPYSWIKAGTIRHKSHQEVFAQIEEIFLAMGAYSEYERAGPQFLQYMELKRTILNPEVQEALDHYGQETLELLNEYGCSILSIQPELFLQMVGRAHCLIGKPFYLEIIEKTVGEYKAMPRKPQDGPLQCLVEQMENEDYKWDLWEHQEKLLTLIQILQEADDSSQTKTRCLRTLILSAGYNNEYVLLYMMRSKLQWTVELSYTVRHLLEGGADIQDINGQPVLHKLAREYSEIGHEAFTELIRCFTPFSNVDIQNEDGLTVLHILAKTLYEHPELGSGLLTVFPFLTLERNVNCSDEDSNTPFSWILIAKARWGNNERDGKIFSEIEKFFLHKGADANLALGPALKHLYRWAWQELSDRNCTIDRLQMLLSGMKTMSDGNVLPDGNIRPDEKSHFHMMLFDDEVSKNLQRIKNAKCISTIMEILRISVVNESTAQHAWDGMISPSGYGLRKFHLSEMDILCLCAERGAQPRDYFDELKNMLRKLDVVTKKNGVNVQCEITRNEELTVTFLNTLVALHRNKHFTCHLQCLGDFYIVPQEILQLGRQLARAVYGTMENCLKSGKFIDCLLCISHDQEKTMGERFIVDLFEETWLYRSPLHLAIIFLESVNSLECLPQNMITKYINTKDLHGCTPLHLAHLHHNEQAVAFLKSHGAKEVTDKFGMSPKSLESSNTTEADVKYKELCHSVLEAKCGVSQKLLPMLVLSEDEAEALSNEVETLFERLVRTTQFENAHVAICGSIREKLKAGCLDEADVQLRFEGKCVGNAGISIAGNMWRDGDFVKELLLCLLDRLAKISWEGIHMRPISVHGPWKFLRERGTVSLDVVAIIVYEGEIRVEDGYITQEEIHELQGHILGGDLPLHRTMTFCTLKTWTTWTEEKFKFTYFAYEWDIIDSLSASCRLAIVIAKALVQAYDLVRGDRLRVKMPITSYMIKTAMFHILAGRYGVLRNELDCMEANENELKRLKTRERSQNKNQCYSKLECNPQPRWPTAKDVDQHGEEARVLATKIFTLIKCLAQQQRHDFPGQCRKLSSYWHPQCTVEIEDFGEAEYICDVCHCALELLNPNTF